jgi:hypothetical protein
MGNPDPAVYAELGGRRTITRDSSSSGWAVIILASHLSGPQLLLSPSLGPQQEWERVERKYSACQVLREVARRVLSGAINPVQKQENIPQLVLCVSACVFCSCELRGQAVSLGEREGGGGTAHVLQRLRRKGAEEGLTQSKEAGGWAWGSCGACAQRLDHEPSSVGAQSRGGRQLDMAPVRAWLPGRRPADCGEGVQL